MDLFQDEDSKMEILDSGISAVFSNKSDQAQNRTIKKMNDIFDVVKDDDYDVCFSLFA